MLALFTLTKPFSETFVAFTVVDHGQTEEFCYFLICDICRAQADTLSATMFLFDISPTINSDKSFLTAPLANKSTSLVDALWFV